MQVSKGVLAVALVVLGASVAGAQDGLGTLQGRTEKLASKAGAAVVSVGRARLGRGMGGDGGGSGAGFLIDADGRILTASTLVGSSGRIDVYFKGHHHAQAKVVARDPRTRTALLQLEDPAKVARQLGVAKLPFLKLGRSADLKRGRLVATVGNTFDSIQIDGTPTFSLGVVSAMGRVRDADGYKGVAIETDAAINPGGFGGPLVDLEGDVVGVVIEPVSPKRWLGLAVPIDEVARILDDLQAGRSPAAPHLGLSVAGSGEATLEGLKIASVEADGPAAKGGLKAGDVLLSLDGSKIVETYDIERELGLLSQGTRVELGVVRDGKKLVLGVTLGAAKAEAPAPAEHNEPVANTPTTTTTEGTPYLGITVEEREDGVYVKTVVEDSPAAKAKLIVGARIVTVEGKPVAKKHDIIEHLRDKAPGDKIKIAIQNEEGFHKTVTVTLGTKEPRTAEEPRKTTGKPAFLGVRSSASEDEDAQGLKVELVLEGSAAEKAGLKVGDSILEFDGEKVTDPESFTGMVKKHFAGDTVKMKISREGKSKTLTITLGERPSNLDQQPSENPHETPPTTEARRPWIGFEVEERAGKVVVTQVAPGSPAESAKIKPGYAVIGAGDASKLSIDDLEKVIDSKKIGDSLTLKVENEDGWSKTVTVTLAERPKDK